MRLCLGLGFQHSTVASEPAEPTAPSAFTVGQWSVADTEEGGTLEVTISALPSNGGSAITDIEYRIDGGAWTSSGLATTGSFDITGLTDDVEVDVEIRAVNAIGNGDASDVKSATPTEAEFAPSDIANLSLWLDASNAGSITHVGGLVSQWNDLSGGGNHVTQSSDTSKPKTGTRTQNSLNVLDFDGTNDKLVVPSGLFGMANGASTMFFLSATDDPTKATQFMFSGTNGGLNRFRLNFSTSGTLYEVINGNASSTTGAYTADTSAHAFFHQRSGTALTGRVDGPLIATSALAVNSSLDALAIGTQANNVGNALNGVVAEVLWYARALNTTEINQVGNYLAAKWGISWATV